MEEIWFQLSYPFAKFIGPGLLFEIPGPRIISVVVYMLLANAIDPGFGDTVIQDCATFMAIMCSITEYLWGWNNAFILLRVVAPVPFYRLLRDDAPTQDRGLYRLLLKHCFQAYATYHFDSMVLELLGIKLLLLIISLLTVYVAISFRVNLPSLSILWALTAVLVAIVFVVVVKVASTCLHWALRWARFFAGANLWVTPEHTTTNRSGYSYRLLTGTRSIRLLKLPRSRTFGELQCNLIEVELDKAPEFEAISYTWGASQDNAKTESLLVDGYVVKVTFRTMEVLHSRHSAFWTRLIWIDALCINQSDKQEAAQQVRIMGDIYKRAIRTVICLGEANDARLAFNLVDEIIYLRRWHRWSPYQFIPYFQGQTQTEKWPALIRLLTHPWFDRTWVIQECILARESHVLYGGDYIPWLDLLTVTDILKETRQTHLLEQATTKRALLWAGAPQQTIHSAIMFGIRERLLENDIPTITELMPLCINFKATDPRDKVFALYGLVKGDITERIPVDYGMTVREVYENITLEYLNGAFAKNVLPLAGVGFPQQLQDSPPSWCPDWSDNRRPNTLARMISVTGDTYCASKGFPPTSDPKVSGQVLCIRGIHVDILETLLDVYIEPRTWRLCSVSRDLRAEQSSIQWILNLHYWLNRAWIMALSQVSSERETTDLAVAFIRTLVGGREVPMPIAITATHACFDEDQHGGIVGLAKLCAMIDNDWLSEEERKELGWERGHQIPPQLYLDEILTGRESISNAFLPSNSGFQPGFAFPLDDVQYEDHMESIFRQKLAELPNNIRGLTRLMHDCAVGRRFGVTHDGKMVFVPPGSAVGDQICIFQEALTPFVIRLSGVSPVEEDVETSSRKPIECQLVGECYVEGIMKGEALKGDVQSQLYRLT